jgi:hypothetical protein
VAATAPPRFVQLMVKTVGGDVEMRVRATATLAEAKKKLEALTSVPAGEQRLVFGRSGNELCGDALSLASFGVGSGATLFVCKRVAQIFVKDLAGKTNTLDVDSDFTGEMVKALVEKKTRVLAVAQRELIAF